MRKFRKGDLVQVLVGKEKGRRGKIVKVLPGASSQPNNLRLVVEGINLKMTYVRPSPPEQPGGIVPKEGVMPACKVQLVDPQTDKPSKIGIQQQEGKRNRYFKGTGEVVDVST